MFCCRAILHIKERTCLSIQPLHITRSYESFVKKFNSNNAKQYCTYMKNGKKKRETENISKMSDICVNEQIQSDFKNMARHEKTFTTNLCKETDQMNTTGDTSKNINISLHKDLHVMYPNPSHTVHGFYQIVKAELKDNSVFNVHFKKVNNHKVPWKCIYSISWPEKIEFTAQGVSKVAVSRQAAWKCLHWLHLHNKIRDNKPIIYSNEEVKDKLQKPIPIHLNDEFVEKIRGLLEKYEMDIKDIILDSQINNNTSTNVSFSNDFIHNRPSSFLQSFSRNKELQDRLLLNDANNENALPICDYRDKILQKLENNQIILIRGDTGCGKSTQVPQFIMNSFIKKGNATDCNMLISQPRRISASSLAERVAAERNEVVGDVVGYIVRLEAKLPKFPGAMAFCTTGILRQLIQANPNLEGYSHIILDEAHERSLDIDVLLVLLKRALQNNPTLKLIVMSATINTDLFQKYYNCTSVDVPGKIYPVKMHYIEDFQHILPSSRKNENIAKNVDIPQVDCNDVASLIRWIVETKPPGTILCFLPGWAEITKVQELLTNMNSIANKVMLLPLHSKLSNINQRNVFKPAPQNVIKVILATDIAETGITIPDVMYVVDSAIRNDFLWDDRKFSPCMNSVIVSQANIEQRKGRAGRTQPGESYHFIRKEEYGNLEPYPIPEILRCSLETTVLEIKTYTNEKVLQFCDNMLQPPNQAALYKAVTTLRRLDILDERENLTALGKLVARIPVHPTLGKAMVLSTFFECVQPILNIVTIYSMDSDLFSNSLYDRTLKQEIKERFHKKSDYLAMSILYDEWEKSCKGSDYDAYIFCNEMGISPFKIRLAAKTRAAFIKYLEKCNLLEEEYNLEMLPNKNAFCEEIIHGIILSSTNKLLQYFEGSYVKGVFRKKPEILNENNERVDISNESINRNKKCRTSPFFTYLKGVHLHNRPAMKVTDTSVISPLTTLLFSQNTKYYKHNNSDDSEKIIIKIGRNRKLLFSCNSEEADLLMSFNDVIWSLLDYLIKAKSYNVESLNELNRINEYKSELLHVLSQMLSVHDTNKK